MEKFQFCEYGGAMPDCTVSTVAGVQYTLYYNFASEEALFLALLDERIEERITDIDAAFEQATTSTAGTAAPALPFAR